MFVHTFLNDIEDFSDSPKFDPYFIEEQYLEFGESLLYDKKMIKKINEAIGYSFETIRPEIIEIKKNIQFFFSNQKIENSHFSIKKLDGFKISGKEINLYSISIKQNSEKEKILFSF